MPKRIQLKRVKGWRKPANTVIVSRPSRWGNPYTIATARKLHPDESETELAARCVRAFEAYLFSFDNTLSGYLEKEQMLKDIKMGLRGKNLGCWCPLSAPCHADTLLRIANK